jgi:hypothetical protein
MNNLMHAASKEARNDKLDIKRQVGDIKNVFSISVEVNAQEAVYLVLKIPLNKSTRDVVLVNTYVPNQRVQLLKSNSALDELPTDSTDIMSDNMIKRYSKCPKKHQKVLYNNADISYLDQNDEKHAGQEMNIFY